MGCDIHFYVERRNGSGWKSCDVWEKPEYEDEGDRLTVPYGKHFYGDRNYDTFAILANVRNGHGFAGVDTGDGFVPIAEPRGLPDDLSPELKAEADAYLEHTPTWLLLKELMDYDWTRTTTKRGWVSGAEFEDWTSYNRGRGLGPRGWSGGVSGGSVQHISEQEMERRVQAIRDEFKGRPLPWRNEFQTAIKERLEGVYCLVSWQTPYYRAASSFLSETLPRLWRLGAPEDVRCVFWFDS
jgi:hypothetical protein